MKKGISSVLATVLIVAVTFLAISIVSVVILQFMGEKGNEVQQKIYAIGNIQLKISDIYFKDNNLYIVVENLGSQDISGFVVKIKNTNGTEYVNNSVYLSNKEKLGPGHTKSIIIIPAPFGTNSSNYESVEVIPKFIYNNKEETAEVGKAVVTAEKFGTSFGSGGGGSDGGGTINDTWDLSADICVECISPSEIIPYPQKFVILSNETVMVNSSWKIYADLSDVQESFNANYLKNLTSALSVNVDVDNINNLQPEKRIIIGNPNKNSQIASIALAAGIDFSSDLANDTYNQGYVLVIQPDQILILGNSTGEFYGIVSLSWLLKNQGNNIILGNLKIKDWPDLNIRGWAGHGSIFHHPSGIDDAFWTVAEREQVADDMVKYKYNLWFDSLWPQCITGVCSMTIAKTLEIQQYLKDRHFYNIITLQPDLSKSDCQNQQEGLYAYNISMKFNSSNYAVSLEDGNILNNSDFETDSNSDKVPDYWQNDGENNINWKMDCTSSYSGSCSMYLNSTADFSNSGGGPDIFRSANYYPKQNRTYIFTFYAKRNEPGAVSDSSWSSIEVRNLTGQLNGWVSSTIENTGQWAEYEAIAPFYNIPGEHFTVYSRAYMPKPIQMWVDKFEMRDLSAMMLNVVNDSASQPAIWNSGRTKKYVPRVDYVLEESGAFNFDNPLNGKRTFIRRLTSGSIPENANILVDYDFLAKSGGTRSGFAFTPYSMSDDSFYSCWEENLVKPMMKEYNPDYIFLNMNEIFTFNLDGRSIEKGRENYEVVPEFYNNLTQIIKKYKPDTKFFAYDDMVSPFHNGCMDQLLVTNARGGKAGETWYGLDLLSRNITLWTYYYENNDSSDCAPWGGKMADSPDLFSTYGFNYMGFAAHNELNIKRWSYIASSANPKPAGFIGSIMWAGEYGGFISSANYSWHLLKMGSVCSPEYPEICDGKDNDCNNLYNKNLATQSFAWPDNIDEGFNLSSDAFNCGSCGNICYYPKAYSSCVSGTCQFTGCYKGYSNADGNLVNGCENKI